MTLIVEDGSGMANAESLASVDYANAYHLAHGGDVATLWAAASPTRKEQALRDGSLYVDTKTRPRLDGYRKVPQQRFCVPRYGACDPEGYTIDPNSVPYQMADGASYMAAESLSADILAALDASAFITSERVGPLEATYQSGAPVQKLFPRFTSIMASLLGPANQLRRA